METSTPYFTDPDDDYVYPANKAALVGCWITFLILACAVNVVVIVVAILLYVKQRAMRTKRPKFIVMLACSVLLIFHAMVPAAMAVHTHRLDYTEFVSAFTCEGIIALELMNYMCIAISNLFVGAVVVAEGLRLQAFVSLSLRVHMLIAALLVAACVLYGFVVIIPLFYSFYLSDGSKPCHDGTVILDTDYPGYKMVYIASFLVPHCLVFWACLLLLVVYFTRPSGTRPGVYDPFGSATDTHHSQGGDASIANPAGTQQQPGVMSSGQDVRFPWYCLVAAAGSFVLGLVFFLSAYVNLRLRHGDSVKVWLSGLLLESLRGIFLPCCWLLSWELRAVWTRCCKRRAPGEAGRTSQEGQEAILALRRLGSGTNSISGAVDASVQ